jgi:hypothetical protein
VVALTIKQASLGQSIDIAKIKFPSTSEESRIKPNDSDLFVNSKLAETAHAAIFKPRCGLVRLCLDLASRKIRPSSPAAIGVPTRIIAFADMVVSFAESAAGFFGFSGAFELRDRHMLGEFDAHRGHSHA